MIIRTKSGGYGAGNASILLDYLGIRKEAAGIQKVAGDVELIASVPIAADKGEGSEGIGWTFSTFDLDRYAERIDPLGWDFKQYLKNPVIQWAHCFSIPAIGRAENIFVDENGLHGSLVFNDKEYDPFGWGIGERVRAGVLCAGSVGFRVIEVEIPSKEDSKDGTSLIFRKQELLEFSVCNVPANPFALVKNQIKGETEQAVGEEEKFADEAGSIASPYWGGLINNF
jgi:HK97 family phage prohead protease